MNLLNKGIRALLLAGLMFGCSDDDTIVAPKTATPSGITKVVLSSFEVVTSGDGTVVTVTPLSIGADSYEVDFGDDTSTDDVLIISGQNGSVTYDYPNELESVNYTITVVGMSDGDSEDSDERTVELTITHTPAALTSVPTLPTVADIDLVSVFSDAIMDGADPTEEGTAQYSVVEVGDPANSVIQYSRLQDGIDGTISFDSPIVIADAFGAGESADYLHIDLHSIHDIGIDKVKISLGGQTYELDLVSDEWTAFDIDLTAEGITTIDDIVFELGTGGTATDEATLNIDNIYLSRESLSIPNFTFDDDDSDYSVTFTDASELATSYSWDFGDGSGTSTDASPTYAYTDDGLESTYTVTLTTTNSLGKTTSISQDITVGVIPTGPIDPVIVHGDLNLDDSSMSDAWKIPSDGSSNPFGRSSDGSCTSYDGVALGAKTRGAKWSGSQSANADGTAVAGNTRYAYQAVTLSPNTDYIFEYEYAIKTGGSATNSIVGSILNGHFAHSTDAVASNALVQDVGTIAEGKFSDDSCSYGTTVMLPFKSNAVGEVSILIYAVTDVDAYVDNIKIYPAP